MASPGYLASAVVFGLVLVGVVVALARSFDWRVAGPARPARAARDRRDGFDVVADAARSPVAWLVGFLALALGGAAAAVVLVGGATGPVRQGTWLALGLVTAAVFGGYVFWGTYQSARSRGVGSATAVLAGLWLLGSLFVVAVIVRLVTS